MHHACGRVRSKLPDQHHGSACDCWRSCRAPSACLAYLVMCRCAKGGPQLLGVHANRCSGPSMTSRRVYAANTCAAGWQRTHEHGGRARKVLLELLACGAVTHKRQARARHPLQNVLRQGGAQGVGRVGERSAGQGSAFAGAGLPMHAPKRSAGRPAGRPARPWQSKPGWLGTWKVRFRSISPQRSAAAAPPASRKQDSPAISKEVGSRAGT